MTEQMGMVNDPVEVQKQLGMLLKQAREWNAPSAGMALGGGPFNTEVSKLMLAAHIQLLEALVEGKVTTKLPSRHHA